MKITFDDPNDYKYEAGIEVADSEIRLIDPNQTTPLAAYWQIIIEGDIIVASVNNTYSSYVDGIPAVIFRREPSFEDIHNAEDFFRLDELWEHLRQYEPGIYYMGVLLGGMTERSIPWPFYSPNAYWSFDDDTANESQGLGYNGTLSNISFVDGQYGRAVYVGSTNGQINFGNYSAFNINGDLTLSIIFKPESFSTRSNIIDKAYWGEFALTQETNGGVTFYHGVSTSNYEGFGTPALDLNKYHTLTFVRDMTNYKLHYYLNGMLSNTYDVTLQPSATTNAVYLGKGYTGYSTPGVYDEFLIYPVALSAEQVACIAERNTCQDTEAVPTGQMSIQEITVEFMSDIAYPGNVIKEKAVAYLGSDRHDTLVHLSGLTEATSDYSNILFTRDREKLDYVILNEGSGEVDIIVNTPNETNENIIVRINDSYDASWQSSGLYGAALDFKTGKDVYTFGPANRLSDTWEFTPNSGVVWEIQEPAKDFIIVVKKNLLESSDVPRFDLIFDDQIVFNIPIDDNNPQLTIGDLTNYKPDMPWTTKYIKFHFRFMGRYIGVKINDTEFGRVNVSISPKKVQLRTAISTIQMKGSYLGQLATGTVEMDDQDQLEAEILATGEIKGLGDMYYAGNQNISAIHKLHIVKDYIYKDKKLYAKTPLDLNDAVICGLRDVVTGKEMLFYGSKSDFDHIYIYEDEAWRIYEKDVKLYGVWRSLHTEGLVIQRMGEASIKIYLLTRDENKKLVYKRDISFTGLPYGDHKFELNMDRRKLSRSVPWVWAEDESLHLT